MRDIYLIDFENVASEGLSGITYLAPEDEVIIFYSNNSKSLSMKMHILIGKSVCKLDYFEATVGGKNALDHQISTWLGYLVGTNAAERNYYIVSRDMGYKFVASFWADSPQKPNVHCVESIKAASRQERNRNNREVRVSDSANGQTPMLKPAEPVLRLQSSQQEERDNSALSEKLETSNSQPHSEREVTTEPDPEPSPPMDRGSISGKEESELEDIPRSAENTQEITSDPQMEFPSEAESGENRKSYRGRQRYYHRNRGKNGRNGTQDSTASESGGGQLPVTEHQMEQRIVDRGLRVESRKDSDSTIESSVKQEEAAKEERSAQKERTVKEETVAQMDSGKKREKAKNDSKTKKMDHPQEAKKANQPLETAKPERSQETIKQEQEAKKPEQTQIDKVRGGEKKTTKPRRRSAAQKTEEPRRVELSALLAPYPGLQEQQLQQLIAENKRQILCNTLRKQLGQEKGLALYNEIKKCAWR